MVKTKCMCMWMQAVNRVKELMNLIIQDHRHHKEAVPKKPRDH